MSAHDVDSLSIAFTEDPAEFLALAGPLLEADPVLSTVVATVTSRAAAGARIAAADGPCWWVSVSRGDEVVGAAMRTAPFRPYPLYVLPMPDEGAVRIARALHERGEDVPAANGALPATRVLAEEAARLVGGSAAVHEHMRLFDLPALHAPAPVRGRLRLAGLEDHAVCLAWFEAFHRDAAEQAGRPYDEREGEHFTAEDMTARIEAGRVWLWEGEAGEVVHLTAANAPAYGVVRIGPVYTPRQHRGRGFASAAVAAVSQLVLDAGDRPCLFTDQANPTSNRIYEALGYRRVVDMVNMVITRAEAGRAGEP